MANDPTFSNVTTLLDFESAGGFPPPPPFQDRSDQAASWSAVGLAEEIGFESKFGSQSLNANGGGLGYTSATSLFDVAGDFTIQLWVKLSSTASASALIESGGLYWGITTSGTLEIDGGAAVSATGTETITTGSWVYLELSRDAGTWRTFVDGVADISIAESSNIASSSSVRLAVKDDDTNSLQGYVDDFRISDNEVLNTTGYTPPTVPHPTSSTSVDPDIRISLDGPLRSDPLANAGGTLPQFVATSADPTNARLSSPSPLGEARLVAIRAEATNAWCSAPSPFASVRLLGVSDFTSFITDPTDRYVVEITGNPVITVPVSSWQATLQTERSNFLQIVIPASGAYIDALTARRGIDQFIVYRETTIDGQSVRSEMARAGIDTVTVNSGSVNSTATIQGYTTAFDSAVSGDTVNLQKVRSRSQTLGGAARVRCSIDWLLRPGQTVTDGEITFTAGYINYFVPTTGDSYMDVGSRG